MRLKKLLWHSDADCIQLSTGTVPHPSSVHITITTSIPLDCRTGTKGMQERDTT